MGQREIIEELHKQNPLSLPELAERLGTTRRAISVHIRKLHLLGAVTTYYVDEGRYARKYIKLVKGV